MFASTRHLLATRRRGFHSPLDSVSGLPTWATLTRAQCPASWQSGPAVNGTTFVAYSLALAANTPRFSYVPLLGKRILVIEPDESNVVLSTIITDVGTPDQPDGFVVTAGAPAVDWSCEPGAPSGGQKFQIWDTAVAHRGVNQPAVVGPAVQHVYSAWVRRTGAGVDSIYGFSITPGYCTVPIGVAAHDWLRLYATAMTVGGGPAFMSVVDDPAGIVEIADVNCMWNKTVSGLWVPTDGGGGGVKLAEVFAVDPSIVPCASGSIEHIWVPQFSSADVIEANIHVDWAWNVAADFLYYNALDRKVYWRNAGVDRAASAALVFAPYDPIRILMEFNAAGTRLTIGNNAPIVDGSAWVAPVPTAPGLSRLAGSYNPSLYCDLSLVGA